MAEPLFVFQRQALEALARYHHVLCIAPTGSGKSRIYEEYVLRTGLRTLLVTPLIALGRQQCRALSSHGIRVTQGYGDRESVVWIVSPESLQSARVLEALRSWVPEFLVVDECHCLWDWGERFRPAFKLVPGLIAQHGVQHSLWLSATLPWAARRELQAQLDVPLFEMGEFALPQGLSFRVQHEGWSRRPGILVDWIRRRSASGIVFVPTREATARLARLLAEAGFEAIAYHAGLCREERVILEQRIAECPEAVVIATSAFGMGMHYPHLRWVVLWQAPPSLLFLAQAIGRAGRGGRGEALLLWAEEDFRMMEWQIADSERGAHHLYEVFQFCRSASCRVRWLQEVFNGFGTYPPCGQCDVCCAEYGAAHHALEAKPVTLS